MPLLWTRDEAAEEMGAARSKIEEWALREENPLPTVPIGKQGSKRDHWKVVASQADSWLAAEAERSATARREGE